MGYPVVHFEITGTDSEKLHEYYGELFGWPIDVNNEMGYGVIDKEGNGGDGISGGIAKGPEGYPGHVTFYVAVPDVEESLAKAESLGGSRMMGPMEVMSSLTIGMFTDPEGHVVGVMNGDAS